MSLSGQLKVYLNGRQPTHGEEFSKVPRNILFAAIKRMEEQEDIIQMLREEQARLTALLPPDDDLPPAA